MKSFRTAVAIDKPPFHISHKDSLMFIGSCFSESIGHKFQDCKFTIDVNPFGQQYNPASIAHSIDLLVSGKVFTAADLIFHNEQYHSFAHHGSFSRNSAEETLQTINTKFEVAVKGIKNASVLFITPGTSHVFKWKNTGEIVSNCHKIPNSLFSQELLSPEAIIQLLSSAILKLRSINREVKIVFTVSPVRYLAYGAYQNNVSKAHLFTSIYHLLNQISNTFYFPAYELVMDDLRDYRFYKEDMIHPNAIAVDYVWQNLCQTFFADDTISTLKSVEELAKAVSHRPRNPNSEAHRNFMLNCLQKMQNLTAASGLNFEKEIRFIQDNFK